MKKILLISPNAHRGGSQILLLDLTKALHELGKIEIEFLLMHGGELLAEFETLAKTHMYLSPAPKSIKSKVKKLFSNTAHKDISTLSWNEYDCVISNTITNGYLLNEIRQYFKGPLISYIHELELSAKTFSTPEEIRFIIALSDHFIVVSNAVQLFLEERYKVPPTKITIFPTYIPQGNFEIGKNKTSKNVFIVGGAGTIDWRKGPDLFIQVAHRINRLGLAGQIKFIWIGADTRSLEYAKLQYDITKLKLKDVVSFEKPAKKLDTFYQSLDVFLLTSREDPYPLVVLDAAMYSLPAICFNDAGGIPEFVTNSGGGICVDYMDLDKAANAILYYYRNADAKEQAGALAKRYLIKNHQNGLNIINQLINICDNLITG